MGVWDTPPTEAELHGSPRKSGVWDSPPTEAELHGAGEGGAGGEGGSTPSPAQGFQLPHPERPVEGLEYDPKTHQPMGSLTGPANPIRATALGLANGVTLGNRAKLAAGIDSALPEFLGGKKYEDALADERNVEALNEKVYPTLTGVSHFAGVAENPIMRALGAVGSAAKGVAGVGLRMLGGAGAGATAAAAEAGGNTDASYTDPATIERMKTARKWGAAGGAAGQLVLGEPVRAVAGALGNQIGRVDAKAGELADAEIASAQGRLGKQGQEAVGGRRNLELEAMMERNAAPQAPAVADTAPAQRLRVVQGGGGPVGVPPEGTPGYYAQGLTPDEARQFFVSKLNASPSQAEQWVQQAGPYLKQPPVQTPTVISRRMQPPAPPVGPAQQALNDLGPARGDLKQRGIDNAMRAIREEQNNPVQVPSRDEAMANAIRTLNEGAKGEAKRGAVEVAMGAGLKAIGNPMGAGTYNIGHGVRRLARAALNAPAVMSRLRGIPGVGRAIGNAAGRGSAALGATLYALSADPKVAAELQKVDHELTQADAGREEE